MARTLSPQTLTESDRRRLAAWAADCTERALPLFEAETPDEDRPRDAITRSRAFARGELTAAGEIRRRLAFGALQWRRRRMRVVHFTGRRSARIGRVDQPVTTPRNDEALVKVASHQGFYVGLTGFEPATP